MATERLMTCNLCCNRVEHTNNKGHLRVVCSTCGYVLEFPLVKYEEGLRRWNKRRSEARHGSFSTYSRGCRCELCVAANREKHNKYERGNKEARRVAKKKYYATILAACKDNPDSKYHGSHLGYQAGCRCEYCVNFYSDYRRELRRRKIAEKYEGVEHGEKPLLRQEGGN